MGDGSDCNMDQQYHLQCGINCKTNKQKMTI